MWGEGGGRRRGRALEFISSSPPVYTCARECLSIIILKFCGYIREKIYSTSGIFAAIRVFRVFYRVPARTVDDFFFSPFIFHCTRSRFNGRGLETRTESPRETQLEIVCVFAVVVVRRGEGTREGTGTKFAGRTIIDVSNADHSGTAAMTK